MVNDAFCNEFTLPPLVIAHGPPVRREKSLSLHWARAQDDPPAQGLPRSRGYGGVMPRGPEAVCGWTRVHVCPEQVPCPQAIPVVQGLFILVRGLEAFINLGPGGRGGSCGTSETRPHSCPKTLLGSILAQCPQVPLLTRPCSDPRWSRPG